MTFKEFITALGPLSVIYGLALTLIIVQAFKDAVNRKWEGR